MIRDEGADWVRFDLVDQRGILASIRAPREMLAPYARELLDAAIRSP